MGILARDGSQYAEGRCHSVASAFNPQLDDVFRVEVLGVGCKGGSGGMLDTLVDGQDGEVPCPAKTSVIEERLKAPQDRHGAIGLRVHTINKIRTRQIETLARNGLALMFEEGLRIAPQEFLYIRHTDTSFQKST
jgi:hypothetical protein